MVIKPNFSDGKAKTEFYTLCIDVGEEEEEDIGKEEEYQLHLCLYWSL
jgi:hypothetical protein